ncbi:hypothetical protein TrVGV298_009579 [Trichoderma virens]|nr:hypothetical protein TrVGV298_009579 [Trichoderma virens]
MPGPASSLRPEERRRDGKEEEEEEEEEEETSILHASNASTSLPKTRIQAKSFQRVACRLAASPVASETFVSHEKLL